MRDSAGYRLLLNLQGRVVYSTAGPSGPLPQVYSFGCNPTVFLGSSDE